LSIAALKGKKVPSPEEFYDLYINKEKSLNEISKITGLSCTALRRLARKYEIKTRTLRQATIVRARKEKEKALDSFDEQKYNGLKRLIELFGTAEDNEDVQAVVNGITREYLTKLHNLYCTIGQNNLEEEINLIAKNSANKLESLLLKCLYIAYLRTGIDISEIEEDSNQIILVQKLFTKEVRKEYIRYSLERKNNSNNSKDKGSTPSYNSPP